MGSISIKSVIALIIGVSFQFTEIQAVTYQYGILPFRHRFNSYAWSSPVSLLDFFRPPTLNIRGMGDLSDPFTNQWQHAAALNSPFSRYRANSCRHRDDVYQEQKMVKNSEQNSMTDYEINQRNTDWDIQGHHHSTSNNPHQREHSSNNHRNPQSLVGKYSELKPRENNEKINRPGSSYQKQKPSSHFPKQTKITSPPLGRNQERFSSSNIKPPKMKEIANLDVNGYYPDEITIEVKNSGQIIIKGIHVCDCEESCFEREFQRRVSLPKGTLKQSLKAVLTSDSKLRIVGYHSEEKSSLNFKSPFYVSVESDGNSWQPKKRNSDPTCGGQKRGIKLKQMESNSRQIIEDYPDVRTDKEFEGEIDEDGVTIETDEY